MSDQPAEHVTDLNADLGESFGAWTLGDDAALMEIITSANVACGFHAGDPLTLRQACAMAVSRGVTIGAQVSYRDLAGFGRREMDVPAAELTAEILYQIAALDGIARAEGGAVRYVKPHGALYHRVARDPVQGDALIQAVLAFDPALPLLTKPDGHAARIAVDAGMRVVTEAYADRAYGADGALVPRGQAGAVLTDPDLVAGRAVVMVTTGTVAATDGTQVRLEIGRASCRERV